MIRCILIGLSLVVLWHRADAGTDRCTPAVFQTTKRVVCVTGSKITLHETEGGPAIDTLDLKLAKDERLEPASLKFVGRGFIEIVRGTRGTIAGKRGVVLELASAKKLVTVWSSPPCSKTCLQDFSFWVASEDNQWVGWTYVQYPRPLAEVTELVQVQRFRVKDGRFQPLGSAVAVTLDDWAHKGTLCKDANPVCR